MKYLIHFIIVVAGLNFSYSQIKMNYPQTLKLQVIDTVHGVKMLDNYRWLENKDDPKVKDWSHKQHDFTVNYINSTSKEIRGLKDEIRAYLDRDIIGAPFFKANREFYYAKKKGDQQSKIYTRLNGKEILIFDPEKLDPSGKTSISIFDLTRDGNKAAVGIQYKGDEINAVRIINTLNGEIIGNEIKNVNNFSWTRNEEYAYITYRSREDIDKQIPLKTYLHKLNDNVKNDKFLIAPEDAKNFASVWDDEEAPYTFYSTGDFYSKTLKIKKTDAIGDPQIIFSSTIYTVSPQIKNGKMYIFTNYEAPNFKIMVTDINKPDFENWKDFYSEKETVLEGFVITNNNILIQYKKDVISHISVYDLNGKKIKDLELPEIADVSGMSYHKESNTVYVSFNTFTAASKLFKLNPVNLEWQFVFQDAPPIDTKDIEAKQVFYKSKDGTRIPMFILWKKGLKLDGNNPTLLYGYGGFNISMGPSFVGLTSAFINRGGVYAIACLRGGNEYGEKWHHDGMLLKKQNVFDDFYAAAEYLIEENYTNTQKLAVRGGSNGGLLIGAAVTQRPELFKAAICGVPLLDMIRYHKFLIARYWIPEYGDPDKKEDYDNIIKYSPYHNVPFGKNLPSMLIKAGENDTRVDPLHAKKFASLLRDNPAQINPILLFIDFDSGHGSGQSVDQQVNNLNLEWKWLMNQLGM